MNLSNARVLVTGGAGFIPSHVVDQLVARGAIVTVLDNLSDGNLENLKTVADRIDFQKADVRDRNTVAELVKGKDFVFHLAANANVPRSVEQPVYDFEINGLGTAHVLASCLNSNVKRIIFASSAAVYGSPQYTPIDESHPLHPISPYGAAKLGSETLGFAYRECFGIPFTVIRIFNTYGPRQPRYVIHDLFRKLSTNPDALEVLGTGKQIRDYCYVTDTARALVDIAANDKTDGQIYNIAGGRQISICELVELILDTLGLKDTRVTYTGKSWPGDIERLHADISRIRSIGFNPTVKLEEGLIEFAKWIDTCPPDMTEAPL